MRTLILILAAILMATLFAGCVENDLRPFVAVAGGYGVMQAEPTPAPPKPDVCENCGGTGVVGDGVVQVPCPVCQRGQTRSVVVPQCKDGQCPQPRTTRR